VIAGIRAAEAWAPPAPVCSSTGAPAPALTAMDSVSVLVSKARSFMVGGRTRHYRRSGHPIMARMPRWFRLASFLVAWATAAVSAQGLPAEVESALAEQGLPRDAVVMLVAPAEGGPPRVAHRIDVPVNPASIAKLATTFAALDLLGPDLCLDHAGVFRRAGANGRVAGQPGDQGPGRSEAGGRAPVAAAAPRARPRACTRSRAISCWTAARLRLPPHDPAAFDGQPLRPYNASPDALLVNYKAVSVTITPEGIAGPGADRSAAGGRPVAVDRAAVRIRRLRRLDHGARRGLPQRPPRCASPAAFRAAAASRCGNSPFPTPTAIARAPSPRCGASGAATCAARCATAPLPAGLKPAFEFASPPLAEVIRDINKYSNNVMAQQLFLTLSLQQRGSGSFEVSRDVLRTWWRDRLGGEPPVTGNGSGLSRNESITARQLGLLLQAAWVSPLMPDLVASLPALGLDGTLRRQRQNVGLAHLKTGSLNEVSGVAGYVHGPQGRRYLLVAIANHRKASAVRPAVQALVEWAARQP
jgi:D-alanyl-D-alanine carboxypeptidase/D-alanyl-D-alanine-endopeptidase (penicillin-binding protein 4)